MSLFKPRAAVRPAQPPVEVRSHIESSGYLSVRGWALDAKGCAGSLEAWAGGQRIDAQVRRFARPDVLAHLGQAGAEMPGFEVALWGPAWRAADVRALAAPVELRLDGRVFASLPAWQMSDEGLQAWARTLLAAAPDAQDDDWPRLASFLEGPDGLPAGRWRWVWDAWARCGGPPGQRVRASVEQIEAGLVSGWASDPRGREEVFVVLCAGQAWPVQPARYERQDVAQGLPGAGLATGFDLALPPQIWSAWGAAAEAELQLTVNDRPLLTPPLRLTQASLSEWVAAAEAARAGAPPEDQRAWEAQLTCLAAHQAASLASRPIDPAAPNQTLDEPPDDAQALWALQRAFNDQLGAAPQASVPAAWQALVDTARASGRDTHDPTWRRFAVSLVPAFCAAGALDALRPSLDETELATLAHSDGAWELSLLLPVRALDELAQGRLEFSAALLERIAVAVPRGWLNTESVADAIARLHRVAHQQPIDDVELRRFLTAALRLYDGIGDDVWSRLHDGHLIDAMVSLLGLAPMLDEGAALAVRAAAIRLYGLVPDFWRRWRARQALPADVEAVAQACDEWHAQLAGLAANETRGDPASASWADAWRALDRLHAGGVIDVDLMRRHLIALWPHEAGAQAPWPREALGDDALRLAQHDDADGARWRRLLPCAPVPMLAARHQFAQIEQRWQGALQSADGAALAALWQAMQPVALALSRADTGFIGLPLLATVLQRLSAIQSNKPELVGLCRAMSQALDQGLDMALDVLARRRHEFAAPPAAVWATVDWMRRTQAGAEAGPVDQAIERLGTLWPDWATPGAAESSDWRAAVPGISPLVIVRQHTSGPVAAARADRIARSWGAELTRRGGHWCFWQARAPTDSDRPGGAPLLVQPSWLAALEWLVDHTDFGRFLFVDDDVDLAVDTWLAKDAAIAQHWHGVLAGTGAASQARAVVPGLGMTLSRSAAALCLRLAASRRGARWHQLCSSEPEWIAELLTLAYVQPSDAGHAVHVRRCPTAEEGGLPLFHNLWLPAPGCPTLLTTLGDDEAPVAAQAPGGRGWQPSRIWPPDQPPRLPGGPLPAQQLVLVNEPPKGIDADGPCVIAVARNERVLMPHFLAHYRRLGVRRFVLADNLSTDGTREYLMAQPDVQLYSVDTPYRHSHYGVAWQLAMLAEHAQGAWALLADIDEFLVWPGCEAEGLAALCTRLQDAGHDAATALMVDMYPQGTLDEADFERGEPFQMAAWFDARPALPWRLGSGSYSNAASFVSAVRHRLLPGSPPNHYTAQKLPLMRYRAGVRMSEGLHYASGLAPAPQPVFFAHFKYHRGFRAKVEEEVARKQHYNDAEEYRKYRELWAEARGIMFDPAISRRYTDSHSFADIPWN